LAQGTSFDKCLGRVPGVATVVFRVDDFRDALDSVNARDAGVLDDLLSLIPRTARIITVDGVDGVGKTTLATQIASALGITALDLDRYLEEKQDRYLEALDLKMLDRDIACATSANARVVLSGCLMVAALSQLGRAADFKIYVLRTSGVRSNPEAGEWLDEFELLCGTETAEEIIAREDADMKRFGGELLGLRRELIRYHADDQPHRTADLIVKMLRLP